MNRRRLWTCRLMLELAFHRASWFVTLTFNDEHLPENLSVSKRDIQLFLKRLRVRDQEVRYYAVGEYGEEKHRPHYHLALFGLDDVVMRWDHKQKAYVFASDRLNAAWKFGHIHIGELNVASGSYLTGYLSKKWTRSDRLPPELQGRKPEFCIMSKNPGIGARMGPVLAKFWNSKEGCEELASRGDVTNTVRMSGKHWPLGRYLVRKVREASGYELSTPEAVGRVLQIRDALLVQAGELEHLREQGTFSEELTNRVLRSQSRRKIL